METTAKQRKRRRRAINLKMREDPKWMRIFQRYDLRIKLAQEAEDDELVQYLIYCQECLTVATRRDYEEISNGT